MSPTNLAPPFLVTVLVLVVAIAAGGVARQGSVAELSRVTDLRCDFSLVAISTWDAAGSPTGEFRSSSLVISFTGIDADSGSAEVATPRGRIPIVAQRRGAYLHLLQIDASGFLHATTVFGTSDAGGRFRAVHSRHEYTEVALPGFTSRPEQQVGSCIRPSR